ncbi:hypothetical protein CTAYLR_010141 [Chrysophaeum taylorii]|uniref:methionine--tRNA ligase n=1 Tax=Chrysophaeum taylorii TaxID=2483200 RepID=A0AAD7XJE8_9STRA|nr:hypothetical protein CTAYLR_010141 [Chrysophaeum taylorii]
MRRASSLLPVTTAAAAAAALRPASPVYVTTPIYYVNAEPHIGHAYTSIACDAACRFARLDGYTTKLVTGTDEHGQKVEASAAAAGVEPMEFATRMSSKFRSLADSFEVDYDRFIRTTDSDHSECVKHFWEKLEENGKIYLGAYEGWYCVRDECYYAESELVDGKAPTGADVEWLAEASYFFKLSEYQDELIRLYETDEILVMPKARKNEVLAFLKNQDLRDLSVSRTTFDWGLRVPKDDSHVVYVWIDALCNYLTAIGYPSEEWRTWWEDVTHVVGKDILRFHAIYWPALCLAAGLAPPRRIVAHGWWTKDGAKISKSLGNTVDPNDLLRIYGLDATRFFLLSAVPFGSDGDFSRAAMLASANGFLANALGNLAQRVCTMLFKHQAQTPGSDDLDSNADSLLTACYALPDAMRPRVRHYRFDLALQEVEAVVRAANRYFDAAEPWQLKKSDTSAMLRVLSASLETLRCVAIAYQPFMPTAATRLLDQLQVPPDCRSIAHIHPDYRLPAGMLYGDQVMTMVGGD